MGTMSGAERDGVAGIKLTRAGRHPALSDRIALAARDASESWV